MNEQTNQGEFRTRILRSSEEFLRIQAEWESCRKTQELPCLDQHCDWLVGQPALGNNKSLRAVTIEHSGAMVAAAPLRIHNSWQFAWALKELGVKRTLARFDMRLADFCGPDFMGSPDEQAAQSLLSAMLDECSDCDVIRINQLRSDSVLSRLLLAGGKGCGGRWIWRRRESEFRWLVRIGGTFDGYLKKFSGKKRRYLMWEVRQLENRFGGSLRLSRISEPVDVEAFIRAAQQISAQSWQGGDHTPGQRSAVRYAERGWLGGYLLAGGDQPLAYLIGRQSDGVYIADEAAFDKRLADFSPGKILWLKVIEDLHQQGSVKWLNLGSNDVGYKQFWAHENYPESSIYLIKPSLRNALAFWPMMATRWPVVACGRLSAALGWSSRYNRLMHLVVKLFKRKK